MPEETITIPGTDKKVPRKWLIIGGLVLVVVVVVLYFRSKSSGSTGEEPGVGGDGLFGGGSSGTGSAGEVMALEDSLPVIQEAPFFEPATAFEYASYQPPKYSEPSLSEQPPRYSEPVFSQPQLLAQPEPFSFFVQPASIPVYEPAAAVSTVAAPVVTKAGPLPSATSRDPKLSSRTPTPRPGGKVGTTASQPPKPASRVADILRDIRTASRPASPAPMPPTPQPSPKLAVISWLPTYELKQPSPTPISTLVAGYEWLGPTLIAGYEWQGIVGGAQRRKKVRPVRAPARIPVRL